MPSKAPGPAMLAWPPSQTRSLVWSPTTWPMAAARVANRDRSSGGTSPAMAAKADHLDVPQPGPVKGRRGNHRGVVGEAGQQQRGPLQGLLQVGGALEEPGDGLLLGPSQLPDAG